MSNLQVEYTSTELLADDPVVEPLVVGGVRCHGGFDEAGAYRSPRVRFRRPAIEAWQQHHVEQFGNELLDVPLDTWPQHYPNVAQARLLLEHGVREPIIATLTRIGTVEGFGSMIRYSAVPDMQSHFDDDISGTAASHLDQGLLEAHARDEAGHDDQAGHREMWFAARDVAFEDPVTADQTAVMLERMGIGSGGSQVDPAALRRQMEDARRFDDLDLDLEMLIQRMIRILLIEISAYHVFAWAEELLADTDVVAGEGAAARLVSYIRQDEMPHVDYLRTALTEMRDRSFRGESGRTIPGDRIIGRLWNEALGESLGARRQDTLRVTLREVEHALAARADGDDLLEEFHALGTVAVESTGGDGRSPAGS